MAARGSSSKEQITQKILETFPGSFPFEKEIRVPMTENGEIIEIKVTLTAAKVNVGDSVGVAEVKSPVNSNDNTSSIVDIPEPTEEEKENVKKLAAALNF